MNNDIHLSRNYSTTPDVIFNLIKNGTVFKLTGADEISYDFKEGGSFKFVFHNRGWMEGKFTQIIPDQKVTMLWNVNGFGKNAETGTIASLTISGKDTTTLTLDHTNIQSQETSLAKRKAWTEILEDLEQAL